LMIGAPFAFFFTRAVADAETRRFEAPLRALVGDQNFESLQRGQPGALHYLGDNRLAPDFTLSDRHGRPWRLSERRGKLVIMNFWSITCPPCVEELPSLEFLAQSMKGREDIEVISISTDSGWEQVQKALPPLPALTVLFDPDKKVVLEKFGTRLYPETWFIDARGIIRLRVDGARDWSDPAALAAIDLFL
jgi:thiol-disulfide isomerase/thioredoxin